VSKTNAFETDLLELFFNATALADLAENDATSPATNLYLSLHTADPGEAGNQTTNETSYTSYARVAVARSGAGFTVSGNSVVLAANADFPACTGSTATITHFGLGTASSGTGYLMYKGTVTPNISVSTGVTPRLTTGTTITED
jgi:hypothetical protein